jgi:hypothetical protein
MMDGKRVCVDELQCVYHGCIVRVNAIKRFTAIIFVAIGKIAAKAIGAHVLDVHIQRFPCKYV